MSDHQTWLQQGWQLQQAGHLDRAEQLYRCVLAANPQDASAWVYLGIVQFDQYQFQESVDSYRQAIAIQREFPIAWNNLGNSLRMLGRIGEAEEAFEVALAQKPDYLSALRNRGTMWVWTGEIERGLRWYQEGLKYDPDNAELHRNSGVIHLLQGDFEIGWREYRFRWNLPGMRRPTTRAPRWNGEPIAGKSILLYPEQGLGDAIQFVRVGAELQRRGAHVLVQCSKQLLPLFSSAPGIDLLLRETDAIPMTDYHASFMEVIDLLYTETGEIAWGTDLFRNGGGYLTVSSKLIEYWKRWLDEHSQPFRVGINWQGNPQHHADAYRSIPLQTLEPLSNIPGVQLINLQQGFGAEQLEQCTFSPSILRLPDHVDTDGGAFTDTAAILHHLDLVVTTDTSVAHLAGAIGAAVEVIIGRVPDWRWMQEGEHTRWYPSMHLVRQSNIGCWDDVVKKVTQKISKLSVG